jgi:hypothetical protein
MERFGAALVRAGATLEDDNYGTVAHFPADHTHPLVAMLFGIGDNHDDHYSQRRRRSLPRPSGPQR